MIHRKILDIAGANPDASLDAIASEVSGASVTFVERVLDEYGDPAERGPKSSRSDGVGENGHSNGSSDTGAVSTNGADEDAANSDDAEDADDSPVGDDDGQTETRVVGSTTATSQHAISTEGSDSSSESVTDPSELSEKQHETLLAVRDRPTATQEEIGDELGVSRATVSKRLKEVPGFEWATRDQFVHELFDEQRGTESEPASEPDVDQGTLAELTERVEALESKLERQSVAGETNVTDPELVHKMVHACMEAEYVTEDEELRILQQVIPTTEGNGGPDQISG